MVTEEGQKQKKRKTAKKKKENEGPPLAEYHEGGRMRHALRSEEDIRTEPHVVSLSHLQKARFQSPQHTNLTCWVSKTKISIDTCGETAGK